ncbi:MAG TPA: YSC84-related protein [Candidatus Sulfotelmatobacter sp.]|nr:YSC84-related protein [Candidatus Sulfotelmatobacter sp.]
MRFEKTRILAVLVSIVVPLHASADEAVSDARATLEDFRKKDPDLMKFLEGAAGYAVFPTVGKGGFGIGGAYGKGVLFERGQPVGRTSLAQVTIGFQFGGQAYSEVVFFETARTLNAFKEGQFALAAQASAVAVTAGASTNARYRDGVAVFTLAKGGLMYEASVGGQKFEYEPFKGEHSQ